MRGRKHPFSFEPFMNVWSEPMWEHRLIFFSALFSIPLKRERQPDTRCLFSLHITANLSCSHAHVHTCVFLMVMSSGVGLRRLSSFTWRQEWNAKENCTWHQGKNLSPITKKHKGGKKRCWSEHLCSEHYGNGLPDEDTLPMGLALWIVWSHLHSSWLWCMACPRARAEWLWSPHYEPREVCTYANYRCNIVITESWVEEKHRHYTATCMTF